jgi:hypothetical protein
MSGRPRRSWRAIRDEWEPLDDAIDAAIQLLPVAMRRRVERQKERFGDRLAEMCERLDRSDRLTDAPVDWADAA